MADNVTLNSGSGGDTIAADDIGGTKYPRSKIVIGADGVNDGDVSSANPLPVTGTVDLGATDNAVLDAIAASLAGTLTVGAHAVTNAGTFAVQAAQSGTWTVDLGATDNAVLDAIAASLAGTLTVGSHAVTNAGTFAVQESGAALTALQVIDDWDESDRAKVNLIVGQAGIAAGAGAVGATVPRMTLASDDPAVAALQTLDNCISGNEAQVDVVTQPARAATTDTITAKLATDAIHSGTTALTPMFAKIDAASSGDNTLVAAVASKKIRVLAAFLVAAGDVLVRFESGAGGTALTGQMDVTTNSGFCLPFNPVGWFETASNTLLNLELDGAVSVDGCLVYVEV